MLLDAESQKPVRDPTSAQVHSYLETLDGSGRSSFAFLTRDDESYVQVAGGGSRCVLEWRDRPSRRHCRAYLLTRDLTEGAADEVPYSGGLIRVRLDEQVAIDDVIATFLAFLRADALPTDLGWRDIVAELGLEF